MPRPFALFGVSALVALLAVGAILPSTFAPAWSERERQLIGSMSLSQLPPLPPDPSNRVADNPAAAALGKTLFFETRLSADGSVACASCHLPDRHFQDDLALGRGIDEADRRTMPLAGTAYSPWQFWDGRADSQWAQALAPLENPVEHGTNRAEVVRVVVQHHDETFASVFGASATTLSVDEAFANVGKAIAAFERTLMPRRSRFDDYADAVERGESSSALSPSERAGLRIFIGKGNCINCHNGPLLTDNDFHNTGVPARPGSAPDFGRLAAMETLLTDPFNCLGPFSDADPSDCAELTFVKAEGEELERAFKTPSLRDVAARPPFMHAGQIDTLASVVRHYNTAPASPFGHSELEPLALTTEEQRALVDFMGALTGVADDLAD